MLTWVTDLVQRDTVSNSSKIKSKKKKRLLMPLHCSAHSWPEYGARFILRSTIKDKVNKQMKRREGKAAAIFTLRYPLRYASLLCDISITHELERF